jgi:uncharacterized protein (TIGR03435 family)
MLHTVIVGAVIVGLLDLGLAAQAPKFEVISIKKRVVPLRPPITNVIKGSIFKMPEVSVPMLMLFGWQIRDFQLVGGPEWMRTDWFDVEARASSDTTSRDEMRLMVRSMLADRFGLTAHIERRDMPVYSLELARPDGRPGPNLQRWDDCSKRSTAPRPSFPGEGTQSSGCATLTEVAIGISRYLERPAIDATGLTGTFQYAWYVPPDPSPVLVDGIARLSRTEVSKATQEHLGLTLKDASAPFDRTGRRLPAAAH